MDKKQSKSKTPERTELEKRLEAELELMEQQTEKSVKIEKVDVAALIAERDELNEQMLRSRAEFANYRKRTARDAEQMRKTAAENVIRDLLPVVDHLELALQHSDCISNGVTEGVKLVLKQFHEVLKRNGLEPLPAVGEVFDPNMHEAINRLPSDIYPPDVIVEEYQKGYTLGDKVLRPSKVVISGGPNKQNEPEEQ